MKTNTIGNLFPAHATALGVLTEQFSASWKMPEVALKAFGEIMSNSYVPENLEEIRDHFRERLEDLSAENTKWAQNIVVAFNRQIDMGPEKAKQKYPAFHESIIRFVPALIKKNDTASTRYRMALSLADQSTLPAAAVKALFAIFNYRANTLGIADKPWVKGPLTGLENRIKDLTLTTSHSNGRASHGGDVAGVQPNLAAAENERLAGDGLGR